MPVVALLVSALVDLSRLLNILSEPDQSSERETTVPPNSVDSWRLFSIVSDPALERTMGGSETPSCDWSALRIVSVPPKQKILPTALPAVRVPPKQKILPTALPAVRVPPKQEI